MKKLLDFEEKTSGGSRHSFETETQKQQAGVILFPETKYYEPALFPMNWERSSEKSFRTSPGSHQNHNNIEAYGKTPTSVRGHEAFFNHRRTEDTAIHAHHKSRIFWFLTHLRCSAMCLYCYLVCHYNKCAYLGCLSTGKRCWIN
jgi:spore photoproduct lyase